MYIYIYIWINTKFRMFSKISGGEGAKMFVPDQRVTSEIILIGNSRMHGDIGFLYREVVFTYIHIIWKN